MSDHVPCTSGRYAMAYQGLCATGSEKLLIPTVCLVMHSKSVFQICLHCLVRICVLSHLPRVRISY